MSKFVLLYRNDFLNDCIVCSIDFLFCDIFMWLNTVLTVKIFIKCSYFLQSHFIAQELDFVLFPHFFSLSCCSISRECLEKFGESLGKRVWERINSVFDLMPLAATIDDKVNCLFFRNQTVGFINHLYQIFCICVDLRKWLFKMMCYKVYILAQRQSFSFFFLSSSHPVIYVGR